MIELDLADVVGNPERLARAIEEMRQRMRSFEVPSSGRAAQTIEPDMARALDYLSATLEELEVARDQLQRDNETQASLSTQVERERQQYRELFDLAPMPYLVTDAAGVMEQVNACAAELLDAAAGALIGRPILFYLASQDRSRVQRCLRNPPDAPWTSLEATVLPGATEPGLPCVIRLAPVARDDRRRGFRWMLRDLSSEKRVEELTEVSQRKDEFIAMVGHELRNPLATIAAGLELLAERGDGLPGDRTFAVVRQQVRQMARLLDDLLDASRDAREGMQLELHEVSLHDVVEDAVLAVRDRVAMQEQELQVHWASEPPMVRGDRGRLVQLVVNLLDNAIKYTPDGGRLGIDLERCGGAKCKLVVWDEGIGIGGDQIERLCTMFSQGERIQERAPHGLGIGLGLAQRLAQLHGGQFEIRSRDQGRPRGTEVVVRLPAASAADRPRDPTGPQAVLAPGRRILLIEDNADLAELFCSLLRRQGHDARVAEDGQEALELLESFRPELALVDVGLPRMDGYEVAQAMREHLPTAKIVAVSGYPEDEGKSDVFDAYLVKPIEPSQLLMLLAQLPDNAGRNTGA